MTHRRFRKFNTRDAYPEQSLDNDVCMAVRANNTVYLRGQTAMDLDGHIVGIGDAAAQAENAMMCAKVLLEEAGSCLQDVVKIVIYVTDRAYREPVYRSLRELAMSYFNIYFNLRGERTLRRYSRPVNLARFDERHWMTTHKPIWFIAEHLCDIPHISLLTPAMEKNLTRVDRRTIRQRRPVGLRGGE